MLTRIMEELKLKYAADGKAKLYNHCGNQCVAISYKDKYNLPHNSNIYPREMKVCTLP